MTPVPLLFRQTSYFRQVLTGGTYLSAVGSQQGILISASTVSHCGGHVWKKGSRSEHQCIGLLEEHCSNLYYVNVKSADASAVGKFTTARVWHKAEQWIIRVSLAFGHALDEWQYLYVHLSTCVGYTSISTYIHLDIYYACMSSWIKSVFSRHIWIHACESLWIKCGFPELPF